MATDFSDTCLNKSIQLGYYNKFIIFVPSQFVAAKTE